MFKVELNPAVKLHTLEENETFYYINSTGSIYTYLGQNSSVAFILFDKSGAIQTASLAAKVIRVNPLPVPFADLPLGGAFKWNTDQVYVKTGTETAMYESNSAVDFVGMNCGTKVKPIGKLVSHVESNHYTLHY